MLQNKQLSVADRSINVQSCDVTMTLDIGLRTFYLKASSVGVSCEAGLFVVQARKYRSWSSKKKFLAFIPYKLRTNKRAEVRDMYQHFHISNVVKD
jgi:hypothetical protein